MDAELVVSRTSDSVQRLVFGSTTGGLRISEDQGDQWQALAARLPPILAVSFCD